MPMPKPGANESERDFISRCMSDPVMNEEYPDTEQRAAICNSQWRNKGEIERESFTNDSIERKSFVGVELKADKPGHFVARIATLNVIDKDGDVTLPGAFPDKKIILISAYMHGSWMGELPVGKGTIHEEGEQVLLEGDFNLNSETGKEHYETIKFAPELQEWSYGFTVKALDEESEWLENPKVWRVLKQVDVFEASPVLRGAGINTATLAVKADGLHLAEEAEAALATVSALIARTKALVALRQKEGRTISVENLDRMDNLLKALGEMAGDIKNICDTRPEKPEGLFDLCLQFQKIRNEIGGI